jgi:hypothetical protein
MHFHLRKTMSIGPSAGRIIRQMARSGVLLLTLLAAFVVEGRAQTNGSDSLTREQLEQLVAPIALYPDALLAQVLMASTYPLEIVQAARWAGANSKLKDQALEGALQEQPWDPSVKSIVVVPQALRMMNDKLDWTELLGNAFLGQQEDLLSAVQDLRARADMNGTLKGTSQQKVTKQTVSTSPGTGAAGGGTGTAIVIESSDPQVIYVPTYNPSVAYGTWPYPSYPPYYWYPPGYAASNIVSFGLGVAVGAAIWGNLNWGRNQVNINVNNFNSFNRTNIANANWQHDAIHRKGVPYANSSVAQRFGQNVGGGASAARDQFRGSAEVGQLNLGNQNLQNRLGSQAPGQDLGQRAGNQTPGQGLANRASGAGTGQGARPTQTPGQGARRNERAGNTRSAAASNLQNRAAGGGAAGGIKALDGLGRGQGVRQESARGAASRSAMASAVGGPGSGGSRLGAGAAGGVRGGAGARGGRGGLGRRSDLRLEPGLVLLADLES